MPPPKTRPARSNSLQRMLELERRYMVSIDPVTLSLLRYEPRILHLLL